MRVKMITMLGVLLIAAFLTIGLGDIATAKGKDKNVADNLKDILKPIPTPRPILDPGNRSHATPTPAPVPSATPTPASGTVPQPASMAIQYTWQNSWPGYDATPVPPVSSTQSTVALTALLSDDAVSASLSTLDELAEQAEQARYEINPWAFISALMGIICISYLVYLGYMMIKK